MDNIYPRRKYRFGRILILSFCLIILIVSGSNYSSVVLAQGPASTDACQSGLETAQKAISSTCSEVGENQVCVANLPATLNSAGGGVSQTPDAPIALDTIDSIATEMGDVTQGQLGITVMKAPAASSPGTPGSFVRLFLIGQAYLAKMNPGIPGWFTQGQTLFLSTGTGLQSCTGLPTSGLLIEVPKGQSFSSTVNGVTLTARSTVLLSALPGSFQVLTLDGTVNASVSGQTFVAATGQRLAFTLDAANGTQVVPPFVPAQPIDAGFQTGPRPALCKLIIGSLTETGWCSAVPAQEAPPPPVTGAPAPTLTDCSPRLDWPLYIVQAGDTLFAIALRTGTTVDALQRANCKPTSGVRSGESLHVPRIPVPASPTPGALPTTAVPPTITPTTAAPRPTVHTATATCSPLDDTCAGGGVPGGGGTPSATPS